MPSDSPSNHAWPKRQRAATDRVLQKGLEASRRADLKHASLRPIFETLDKYALPLHDLFWLSRVCAAYRLLTSSSYFHSLLFNVKPCFAL